MGTCTHGSTHPAAFAFGRKEFAQRLRVVGVATSARMPRFALVSPHEDMAGKPGPGKNLVAEDRPNIALSAHETTAASTREAAGNGHQVLLGRFRRTRHSVSIRYCLVATPAASGRGAAAAVIAARITAARMERVTQAGQQIANRRRAAAASVARIAALRLAALRLAAATRLAALRLAARSRLAAGRFTAGRLAAAVEQVAEPSAALRGTAVVATARGSAAAAVDRASIAGIRFASVAVRAGVLEHLGLCRVGGQHQRCGHRKGG